MGWRRWGRSLIATNENNHGFFFFSTADFAWLNGLCLHFTPLTPFQSAALKR